MCFAHSVKQSPDVTAFFDEEDGTVIDESIIQNSELIEGFNQHVDSFVLNFSIESDESILAFIYQTGNDTIIVYTSDEAMELVNEPFTELSELITDYA